MRAFVYLRQSLDRTGEGAAVTRQKEDCLRLCVERGWDVVRIWSENDTSASSQKPRPVYVEMLRAIDRREADVLVAWHVDRLTRKLTDLEHLIEVAQNTGLRIATVTGDVDLSTDAGRLVGRILASVARGEVERKGARQKRAQQQAAQLGKPAGGRRPFGYGSDGVMVVEDEAVLITAAYTDLLAGASLKSIARSWNEKGITTTMGGPWRHDNVRNMLKNPRNAGLRSYRGQVVGKAIWPALVDEETHAAALALLAMPERRTTINTVRKHLLPGLAYCWKCGSDVATGHTRHGKRVYVCRANKCISRKADPVDELVERVMVSRLSQPDAIDLLSSNTGDLAGLRAQAETIRERLDDLAVGLEEGLLTLAAVRKSSDRLKKELGAIEAKINDSTHADVLTPLVVAADVTAAWGACDLQQKRSAIHALMTITLLKPEVGTREFNPASIQIDWRPGD